MLTLQRAMEDCTINSMLILLMRFLYFSILVIIVGRAWCGWICPLGFLQDIMDLIRKKIGIGYVRFSTPIQQKLSWIKWNFIL
jgi:polyferredoxin